MQQTFNMHVIEKRVCTNEVIRIKEVTVSNRYPLNIKIFGYFFDSWHAAKTKVTLLINFKILINFYLNTLMIFFVPRCFLIFFRDQSK